MDNELHRIRTEEEISRLQSSRVHIKEYGWQIERTDETLYVLMAPRGKPEKTFTLRITFEDFPEQTPSYLFVNPTSKDLDLNYWPNGSAFKKEWPGICMNGIREFYVKGHTERKGDWSAQKWPVVKVLQEVQVELNKVK